MKDNELTIETDSDIMGIELTEARMVSHVFPKHFHEDYRFGITYSGQGALFCQGKKNIVPQGNCFFLRPGEIHYGHPSSTTVWHYSVISIHESLIKDIAHNKGSLTVTDVVTTDQSLVKAVNHIYHTFRSQNTTLIEKEQLLYFFVKSLPGNICTNVISASKNKHYLQILCDYIDQNFYQSISVHDLAKISNLHPNYVFELFRKGMGMSPHQYQNQLRINAAKKSILTDKPLADIAIDLGFYDQSHLCRLFKRSIGVTPNAYRHLLLSKKNR